MTPQTWIFLGYFAVVFGIGWYSLRATRNESDYWIAGGQLGWFTGGATMAATHTSAGTFMGVIGVMYTAGWSFGWVLVSIPLAYWFMVAVLAPRFTRQKELTIPAFIETRYYGKGIRGLAAGIILIAAIVYIQAQIVAGGLIANTVFGIPTTWGMIGFTAILLAYTVIGGMVAVVYTDAFQLVVMTLGALFAVPLALRQVDGLGALLYLVESAHPLVFTWETMPAALLFTMGLSFFLGGIATPEKLIRLYAMKDMKTIRRGVLFAIVMILALNLLDPRLLCSGISIDIRKALGPRRFNQLTEANALPFALVGIGSVDHLLGAASPAAGPRRITGKGAEGPNHLVTLNPLGPCNVLRAIAEAQVFRDTKTLTLFLPRANGDFAISRGRTVVISIDDHHVDLVARVILRGNRRPQHKQGSGGEKRSGDSAAEHGDTSNK